MKKTIFSIMHIKSGLVNPIFDMRWMIMVFVVVIFLLSVITGCEQLPFGVTVINGSKDTLLCVINRNPSDSLCPDFENPYESVVLESRAGFVHITESDSTRNLIVPFVAGGEVFGYEYNSDRHPFSSKRLYYYLLVYNWSDIKGLSYSEIRNGNYELSRRKISKADTDIHGGSITLNFPADFELLREVEVK